MSPISPFAADLQDEPKDTRALNLCRWMMDVPKKAVRNQCRGMMDVPKIAVRNQCRWMMGVP